MNKQYSIGDVLLGALVVLALLAVLVVLGPILTIWALNTLFPVLNIPYNLDTWSAVVLLGIFLRGDQLVRLGKKRD